MIQAASSALFDFVSVVFLSVWHNILIGQLNIKQSD